MKAVLAIGVLAFSLAGCDQLPGGQVAEAQKIVRQELIDGSSAKFENVVVQKTRLDANDVMKILPVDVPATCGWVNAKNRMGAFAGAERFLVREGFSTFKRDSEEGWERGFGNCVIHSNNDAATDRLMREGQRAISDYGDAVEALNKQ